MRWSPLGLLKKRMDITYWSTKTRELRDHQTHYGNDESGAAENPHNPPERSIVGPAFFQFFLPQSLQPSTVDVWRLMPWQRPYIIHEQLPFLVCSAGQRSEPGEGHAGEKPSIINRVLVFGSSPYGFQRIQAMVVFALVMLFIQHSQLGMHRGIQWKPLRASSCFQGILALNLVFSMLKFRPLLLIMLHRVSPLPHTPIPRTGYDVLFSDVDVFHLL